MVRSLGGPPRRNSSRPNRSNVPATGPRTVTPGHTACMAAHLELPVRDGGARVTLRSPLGEQLGWWNFSHGGTLLVDLLDPAVCRVDGRTATSFDVVDDFIPWP